MRQLIARIDDELHRELKARAAAEGRSLNSLVTELLQEALAAADERTAVRLRLDSSGLHVVPEQARRSPSRDAAIASTRGAGRVASQALEAERASQ